CRHQDTDCACRQRLLRAFMLQNPQEVGVSLRCSFNLIHPAISLHRRCGNPTTTCCTVLTVVIPSSRVVLPSEGSFASWGLSSDAGGMLNPNSAAQTAPNPLPSTSNLVRPAP